VQQNRDYGFERSDLGALVRETVAAFAHGLSAQGYSFDVQDQGAPAMFVRADPAALEQVLANLLDNAVKYSADNKAITVRVSSAQGFAVVQVIDHGVGIAPRDHKRIFERFYRSSGTERPGFGLGLPLVKELIQAHRGTVDVASAPRRGSTFTITLPLDLSERTDNARLPAEPSKAAS
jgi:two-component system, OmpR family, phosphate regulon sensor histidine kinase PhoR